MVRRIVGTQKQLLKTAINNIKPGGTIVYSTCSVEPEEDEAVISWALDNFDIRIEEVKLKGLKTSKPFLEYNGEKFNPEVKKCLRIWPQDNNTSGFFVTKIIKN